LRRLVAYVAEGNIASRRILEKVGFIQEGICREHYLINGIPTNEVLYGLLRSDWENRADVKTSMSQNLGGLHHVNIRVSNLQKSSEFWGWFLCRIGYVPFDSWKSGVSWKLGETYLDFVQVDENYLEPAYHRAHVGLNHLAFHANSRAQVDEMTDALKARGVTILYLDQHPFAGGPDHYAVYFEDPDRIKVELVAPL
jgi:catechol 2,3-dioxygenase-like lactoylglutathione lyase family enzyme